MKKQTAINAALVAMVMASIGGAHFLKHNPNPTLRDVFLGCEKGEISGIACCEGLPDVKDILVPPKDDCGMITPKDHDPLGLRAKLEADSEEMNKIQQEQQK